MSLSKTNHIKENNLNLNTNINSKSPFRDLKIEVSRRGLIRILKKDPSLRQCLVQFQSMTRLVKINPLY